jgi:hypothetical protein
MRAVSRSLLRLAHRSVVVMLVIAFGVLAACAPRTASTPGAPRPVPEPCQGAEGVLVRNQTGGPIDVYMTEGRTSTFLASVGAGPTTLGLPPGNGQHRSFYGENSAGNFVGGRRSANRLSFTIICQ